MLFIALLIVVPLVEIYVAIQVGHAIGALNTTAGGLSLFAGTATDGPAMAPADTVLADLDALAQPPPRPRMRSRPSTTISRPAARSSAPAMSAPPTISRPSTSARGAGLTMPSARIRRS